MDFVHLEFDGAVATITLDHPGGNRINFQMRDEIYATELLERMGRSMALGRSSAIQEYDHHQSIPRRMAAQSGRSAKS